MSKNKHDTTLNRVTVAGLNLNLKVAAKSGVPLYISGKPGVGKTEITKTTLAKEGYTVMVRIAATMMPEDVGGVPFADITTSEVKRLMSDVIADMWKAWTNANGFDETFVHEFKNSPNKTMTQSHKPVALLADELSNAPSIVQSAWLNFILEKESAGYHCPPDTIIIGAGNSPENSALAADLTAPMANRFSIIDYEGPTFDEFEAWAQSLKGGDKISGYVLYALKEAPDLLHKAADFKNEIRNPTPRSWAAASKNIQALDSLAAKGERITDINKTQSLAACVGDKTAQTVRAVLKYASELRTWEEVKADPDNCIATENAAAAYIQVVELTGQIETPKELKVAWRFIKRLPKEVRGTFCRGCIANSPDVARAMAQDDEIRESVRRFSVAGSALGKSREKAKKSS